MSASSSTAHFLSSLNVPNEDLILPKSQNSSNSNKLPNNEKITPIQIFPSEVDFQSTAGGSECRFPALILNAANSWKAMQKWESRETLIENYGNVEFEVAGVPGAATNDEMKLSEFLNRIESAEKEFLSEPHHNSSTASNTEETPDSSTNQNFDFHPSDRSTPSSSSDSVPFTSNKEEFNKKKVQHQRYLIEKKWESAPQQEMLKDYKIPKPFKDDLLSLVPTNSSRWRSRYFWLGGAGSGSWLHVDHRGCFSGWNTVFFGTKRWAFLPPDTDLEGIGLELTNHSKQDSQRALDFFEEKHISKLRELSKAGKCNLIECTQKRGETVYVPAGWYHCVLNLEMSCAIAESFLPPGNFFENVLWPRLCAQQPAFSQALRECLVYEAFFNNSEDGNSENEDNNSSIKAIVKNMDVVNILKRRFPEANLPFGRENIYTTKNIEDMEFSQVLEADGTPFVSIKEENADDIREKLNEAIANEILANPLLGAELKKMGIDPESLTPRTSRANSAHSTPRNSARDSKDEQEAKGSNDKVDGDAAAFERTNTPEIKPLEKDNIVLEIPKAEKSRLLLVSADWLIEWKNKKPSIEECIKLRSIETLWQSFKELLDLANLSEKHNTTVSILVDQERMPCEAEEVKMLCDGILQPAMNDLAEVLDLKPVFYILNRENVNKEMEALFPQMREQKFTEFTVFPCPKMSADNLIIKERQNQLKRCLDALAKSPANDLPTMDSSTTFLKINIKNLVIFLI